MRASGKIFFFLILFTIGFYLLRTQGAYLYYNTQMLVADLGGLTYLYSTVGIIFAIFAAFVILSEAERWNNLTDAIQGEVGQLHELWLWSRHLPGSLSADFSADIKRYLEALLAEGLTKAGSGEKNATIEASLGSLNGHIFKIQKDAPDLMPTTFSIFSELTKCREQRIHYTSFRLPAILKNTLLFSDILLVVLSLLIGVRNSWLAYIFVGSVATLGYVIYLLVDDMDDPTRPGSWHIKTVDYERLLAKIKA